MSSKADELVSAVAKEIISYFEHCTPHDFVPEVWSNDCVELRGHVAINATEMAKAAIRGYIQAKAQQEAFEYE